MDLGKVSTDHTVLYWRLHTGIFLLSWTTDAAVLRTTLPMNLPYQMPLPTERIQT